LTDEPLTREELSDEFGISPERVRQIEMRAFEKVQRAVKVRVEESDQPGTPRQFVAGVAQEPTFHLE
jgi:RNA polymerase sigma-32 factor